MLLKLQSSIRAFSKIWQYSKYESRKNLKHFHVTNHCGDFGNIFLFYFFAIFPIFFFCDGMFFYKKNSQNGKNSSQKLLIPLYSYLPL
jgi:hypothetical protein